MCHLGLGISRPRRESGGHGNVDTRHVFIRQDQACDGQCDGQLRPAARPYSVTASMSTCCSLAVVDAMAISVAS
jgi:hypothetical protein